MPLIICVGRIVLKNKKIRVSIGILSVYKIQHGELFFMKKIFVGNLSWKVTEEILKPLFEPFGKVVSIKIISDQYTGKSKGFGFVEMETAEGAAQAIQELNDKPLLERNLRVSLAQERTERRDSPRGNSGGGYGGGGQKPYRPAGARGGDRNYN